MSLPDILLDLLKAQPVPLTAAQLTKRLTGKAKFKEVADALDDLVRGGRVFAITQGKSAAYASRPPLDLCAEALAAQVTALTAATAPAKLRGKLPKALQPWFDEALGRLVVRGQACWLPKGKTKLVLPRAVRPSDVITATQLAAVQKVLVVASRHRATALTLEQFVTWLDGEETSFNDETKVGAVVKPTDELLKQWYLLDRGRSSSSMVPIPDTYRRYENWAAAQGGSADEAEFRRVLEELYNTGQAILEPCERPNDLPEEERRLQVPLTFGPPGYYWGPVG